MILETYNWVKRRNEIEVKPSLTFVITAQEDTWDIGLINSFFITCLYSALKGQRRKEKETEIILRQGCELGTTRSLTPTQRSTRRGKRDKNWKLPVETRSTVRWIAWTTFLEEVNRPFSIVARRRPFPISLIGPSNHPPTTLGFETWGTVNTQVQQKARHFKYIV